MGRGVSAYLERCELPPMGIAIGREIGREERMRCDVEVERHPILRAKDSLPLSFIPHIQHVPLGGTSPNNQPASSLK